MMSAEAEHRLRTSALAGGIRNPFCLCCGGSREKWGGTLCRECATWANRLMLRASRLKLRASFALLDGGRP